MFDDKALTTVLHPDDPNRQTNGQFAQGNRASPGRPPKQVEKAILAAVNEVSTPEKIKDALEQMYALAKEYRSWKAYQAALTLSLSYQIGRPVTRIAEENNDALEHFLQRLRNGGQEDEE